MGFHGSKVSDSKWQSVSQMGIYTTLEETRIVDLLAKFRDFPWAQDTVMAAHQLEDVFISYLTGGPGQGPTPVKDARELIHRRL